MTQTALFFLLNTKHFIADFPLQNKWMLHKFDKGWSFVVPLLAHSLIQGLGTLLVLWAFVGLPGALIAGIVDTGHHFIVDRFKASPAWLGVYEPLSKTEYPTASPAAKLSNQLFWLSLGLDQWLHYTFYCILVLFV